MEWRPARGVSRICRTASIHAPDMICLTETHYDLLSQHGYSICSRTDYPYPIREGRRKGFSPASTWLPARNRLWSRTIRRGSSGRHRRLPFRQACPPGPRSPTNPQWPRSRWPDLEAVARTVEQIRSGAPRSSAKLPEEIRKLIRSEATE